MCDLTGDSGYPNGEPSFMCKMELQPKVPKVLSICGVVESVSGWRNNIIYQVFHSQISNGAMFFTLIKLMFMQEQPKRIICLCAGIMIIYGLTLTCLWLLAPIFSFFFWNILCI